MCPPMPCCSRLARTTMAMAFQRMMLLMRRSISRLPGYGGCLIGADGIDVRRGGAKRQFHARLIRRLVQLRQQIVDALRPLALQHVAQRFQPLVGFRRIDIDRRACSSTGVSPACSGGISGATTPSVSSTTGALFGRGHFVESCFIGRCAIACVPSVARAVAGNRIISLARFSMCFAVRHRPVALSLVVDRAFNCPRDRPISLIIRYLRKAVKGIK